MSPVDQPALSILLIASGDALSAFIPALAAALSDQCSASVRIRITSNGDLSSMTALHTLLSLERMIVRRGRPCWADRIDRADIADLLEGPGADDYSLIVDLTAAITEHSHPVFRPCFNGHSGEQALASSLFFLGTPKISIVAQRDTTSQPETICEGIASLESAAGIGGAMEAVWSRTMMLLVKAIRELGHGFNGRPHVQPPRDLPALSIAGTVRHSASALASAAAHSAYSLCCYRPHWRIGWRYSDPSSDVWSRRDLGGTAWNVLRDPIDHFYADPFPVSRDGRDYIFFEDLDHKTQKGIISVVEIDERGMPGPVIPVLEEPWHLSYPFMMEAEGEIWMLPEASLSGQITVYRAREFPRKWERHAILVSDVEAADATITAHNGRLWMFAVVRQGIGGYSDALAIWSSERLFGEWRQHQANPVLINDREARPAGAMIRRNGQLLRPVQDCRKGYGAGLGLARVTRLDEECFAQVVDTYLAPGPSAWPGRKLHTLNSNGRVEVIDGSLPRPKMSLGRGWVDRFYHPC